MLPSFVRLNITEKCQRWDIEKCKKFWFPVEKKYPGFQNYRHEKRRHFQHDIVRYIMTYGAIYFPKKMEL